MTSWGWISLEVTNQQLTSYDTADWITKRFSNLLEWWKDLGSSWRSKLMGKSWIQNLVDCSLLSTHALLYIKCQFWTFIRRYTLTPNKMHWCVVTCQSASACLGIRLKATRRSFPLRSSLLRLNNANWKGAFQALFASLLDSSWPPTCRKGVNFN